MMPIPVPLQEPWASIQFAIDSASAGDTVALLAGTYFERVSFSRSGVAGMPIILRNAAGATAIIDGTGTSGQDALIEIVEPKFHRNSRFAAHK